ncbi:MAG: DegT/DnrJ/EryC1/StrS family aminotransferase, partial [Desulfosalsimonadaceae bacterium]|nr:DegT/DnrJ/EryC1/StrS family aminotransferase [Desulfosalsimonadaceae bacterium]
MTYLKSIARVAYSQTKNMAKIFMRRRLTYPSLVSTTLDKDDVNIARKWIGKRKQWYEPELVQQYEKEFAYWNGTKYAFAFMGGRVALSACIHALAIKKGEEAILPGYTCVVVPNAFTYAGIKIIYCDIELDTYGLDASLIEDKITAKTRVILLP